MKVLLIWPKGNDVNYSIPLSLGYLKGNIKYHSVKILDCSLKKISYNSQKFRRILHDFNPGVVGVSCYSVTYLEALNLLKAAKALNKGIITVMGGPHATGSSKTIMQNNEVDYVFRGEAELSFQKFLNEISKSKRDLSRVPGLVYRKNSKVVENTMKFNENLDQIKIPDYDAINIEEYLSRGYKFETFGKRNAPIWITRGCPYSCTFCSAGVINGKKIRKHSIRYIVNWINYLYFKKDIKSINIIDDNFSYDMRYAKLVCRSIIGLSLKNLCIGTPNGVHCEHLDAELLSLMKRAGWKSISFAPDSGSQRTLKLMNKKINLSLLIEKIRLIKSFGLKVTGSFIIGFPGESVSDIKKTKKLIRKCNFNALLINNFQPLPGTYIYNKLMENGDINNSFLPKNYTNGERTFTPNKLEYFNFNLFILKENIILILSNPLNLLFICKYFNMSIILSKSYLTIKNMLRLAI